MRDSDLTEEQKQIKDEAISDMKQFQVIRSQVLPNEDLRYPLRSLHLKNFKSVSEQNISFKPLSVIVGANSSGKSTLLQSILLIAQSTQTNSGPGSIRLNGNLTKLGRFSEVLNRKLMGRDSPFEQTANELLSKQLQSHAIESEIRDIIEQIDSLEAKLAEATELAEAQDLGIERSANVELLIQKNAELLRIDDEKPNLVDSLNPDVTQIEIGAELFFQNQGFMRRGLRGRIRERSRHNLHTRFAIHLMQSKDDSLAHVYRSNFSLAERIDDVTKQMDITLKTTGRTSNDLEMPDYYRVRTSEALNAGFRPKRKDDLLEVVGSVEAGEYGEEGKNSSYNESNFSIDGNEETSMNFGGFFITASGFDGIFPNTVMCTSQRSGDTLDQLLTLIEQTVEPENPRDEGQKVLPLPPKDAKGHVKIDFPKGKEWDEMSEEEQDAFLFHVDQLNQNYEMPILSLKNALRDWDNIEGDLALRTGELEYLYDHIELKAIRQFIEDHGRAALRSELGDIDLSPTKWESLIESIESREFANLPDQYPLFEAALRETKRLFLGGVRYLGPLRDLNFSQGPEEAGLGIRGQHAPYVLHDLAGKRERYVVPSKAKIGDDGLSKLIGKSRKQIESPGSLTMSRTLVGALNEWLEWFGFGVSISTSENAREGISLDVSDNNEEDHHISMVGVGISQAYPVILQCLLSRPGDILLFEQPELHLHPALQKKMGEFLLYFARERRQIIIETHSEHIVNQLRATAAADPEDQVQRYVQLIFAEQNNGETQYTPSEINKYGGLDEDWPDGFLDESSKLSEKLLGNAIAKKKREIEPTD